jgi:HEXXH motif-containing protein
MREGARSRDRDLMRQARRLWDTFTGQGAPEGVVAVDHCAAVPLTGLASDMPVWAITAEAAARPADATRWVGPAAAATSRCGYGWLTGRALAIVVALHARRLNEATSSWTVSTLPCTVYTDHYPVPALMGKDLVHEAAHSWLNDCLAATRDELAGPAEFWSPWKQRNRTPFGMVHSGFAFSCVVNFLTRLAAVTTDPVLAGYCEQRVPAERGRLTEARRGIEGALGRTRDGRVRAMVAAELVLATEGGR